MGYNELWKKIVSWSLPTKIGLVIGVLGLFFSIFFGFLPYYFPVLNKVSTETIFDNLDVDVNYDYIEQILGKPIFQDQIEDSKYFRQRKLYDNSGSKKHRQYRRPIYFTFK